MPFLSLALAVTPTQEMFYPTIKNKLGYLTFQFDVFIFLSMHI